MAWGNISVKPTLPNIIYPCMMKQCSKINEKQDVKSKKCYIKKGLSNRRLFRKQWYPQIYSQIKHKSKHLKEEKIVSRCTVISAPEWNVNDCRCWSGIVSTVSFQKPIVGWGYRTILSNTPKSTFFIFVNSKKCARAYPDTQTLCLHQPGWGRGTQNCLAQT